MTLMLAYPAINILRDFDVFMLLSLRCTFVLKGFTVQKGDGVTELNLNISEKIAYDDT